MAIVHLGDSRAVLAGMEPCSVDAVVTDPPYEWAFMGRKWDSTGIAFDPAFWAVVRRVLKPGGHLLAFGGARTYHRMAVAIEDAGFDIRDSLHWCYTQGFPKSLDVSKAIDAMDRSETSRDRQWSGWGTALKPAHEPIVLARRPLDGTVAGNVMKWGTGGINVDGCRVGTDEELRRAVGGWQTQYVGGESKPINTFDLHPEGIDGRWPPNLLLGHHPECGQTCLDGCAVAEMEAQSQSSRMFLVFDWSHETNLKLQQCGRDKTLASAGLEPCAADGLPADAPSFSNFRYCPKPSRAEREAGCQGLPTRSGAEAVDREEGSAGMQSPRAGAGRTADQIANTHTTVKPISLMRWLCRLITPPGGTVLDPFTGSGTTGCGAVLEDFGFLGIEREAEYHAIAEARIAYWARQSRSHKATKPTAEDPQQIRLFG